MTVIADTSPLNYLVLIDHEHVLPALYGQVLIPEVVAAELQRSKTPEKVRRWLTEAPAWLQVRQAPHLVSPLLVNLGPGEREAIQIALKLENSLVLMDDMQGRQAARSLDVKVRGTLGVLQEAAALGFCALDLALELLQQTSFRASPATFAAFRKG